MTKQKLDSLIQQFAAQAREYDRTGDVVLRNQMIEKIREVAPRKLAAKVIAEIMTPTEAK